MSIVMRLTTSARAAQFTFNRIKFSSSVSAETSTCIVIAIIVIMHNIITVTLLVTPVIGTSMPDKAVAMSTA